MQCGTKRAIRLAIINSIAPNLTFSTSFVLIAGTDIPQRHFWMFVTTDEYTDILVCKLSLEYAKDSLQMNLSTKEI